MRRSDGPGTPVRPRRASRMSGLTWLAGGRPGLGASSGPWEWASKARTKETISRPGLLAHAPGGQLAQPAAGGDAGPGLEVAAGGGRLHPDPAADLLDGPALEAAAHLVVARLDPVPGVLLVLEEHAHDVGLGSVVSGERTVGEGHEADRREVDRAVHAVGVGEERPDFLRRERDRGLGREEDRSCHGGILPPSEETGTGTGQGRPPFRSGGIHPVLRKALRARIRLWGGVGCGTVLAQWSRCRRRRPRSHARGRRLGDVRLGEFGLRERPSSRRCTASTSPRPSVPEGNGDVWWNYANAISMILVCARGPVIGAITDYTGSKKRFFLFFWTMGVVACAALFFVRPGDALLGASILFIFANIGFGGSVALNNAFLTELAPADKMDPRLLLRLGDGLRGRARLCLALNLFMYMAIDDKVVAVRWCFAVVGLWWSSFPCPPRSGSRSARRPSPGLPGARCSRSASPTWCRRCASCGAQAALPLPARLPLLQPGHRDRHLERRRPSASRRRG